MTLRSALDGSWELLEPWEKRALSESSVFHGGFTLEAAEAVLAVDAATEPPIVDMLEALVEKSLLAREDARPDADVRFRLSESVRDYAAEKLAELGQAQLSALESRHAQHYLTDSEARTEETLAPFAAVADRRVARELDNLLAIARRCDGRDPSSLVRAVICLDTVLHGRGPADAHRRLLERALAAVADPGVSPALRARAWLVSADAHRLHGQLAEARRDLSHAIVAADATNPGEQALVDVVQAETELDAGRLREARVAAERAWARGRASGDARIEVVALHTLVRAHVDADDLENASRRALEALPIARKLKLPLLESRIEKLLGVIAARGARLDKAEKHYEAAFTIARELGDTYLEATSLHNLADVHARRADHTGALARFAAVLELASGAGFKRNEGVAKNHIALIEHDRGNFDAARVAHAEANAIHREIGNTRSEAFGLEEAGLLALEERRLDDAGTMLERARELARAAGLGAVEACSGACLASMWAECGDLDAAYAALELAHAAARAVARPEPTGVVGLHEARVWVAEAGEARAVGDDTRAAQRLSGARQRHDQAADVATHSPRCRIARRMLARAIAAADAPGRGALTDTSEVLLVGDDGRWFQRPGGGPVDLSTRRALRLMLMGLTSHRIDHPGAALSLDQLFEAGWPGERIATSAAHRRVYTAIGTLRDVGLRDLLLRRDDGYLLSPEVPVSRSAKRA